MFINIFIWNELMLTIKSKRLIILMLKIPALWEIVINFYEYKCFYFTTNQQLLRLNKAAITALQVSSLNKGKFLRLWLESSISQNTIKNLKVVVFVFFFFFFFFSFFFLKSLESSLSKFFILRDRKYHFLKYKKNIFLRK